MCGIAGVLALDRDWSEARLAATAQAMAGRLAHRGPDAEGVWTEAESGVAFGHRRLSIVDLSAAGAQPMTSSCGRMTLCYNGEAYNAAEVRRELEARGRGFRGHSDTEALVEACAEWGVEAATRRFVGMFAFAVWDRAERALTLARDRMGVKPLYWRLADRVLAFASEPKALEAAPGPQPEISREGLAGYLRFGYAPAPFTIWRDVWKLQPGEMLRLTPGDGAPTLWRYWSLDEVVTAARAEPAIESDDEAAELIEPLLARAVRDRLMADVPLGAFLSGGVDSSLVTALMAEASSAPVRSFSIGFHDEAYNEADHAKAVAAHLGAAHTEHYVGERDLLEAIPQLAEIYDEPFADSSQIPTLLLSRLTRRDVTVALSGDGGDEVFAGYNRYLWAGRIRAARQRLTGPGRRLAARALERMPASAWDGWIKRAAMRRSVGGGPTASLARRAGKLAAMMRAPDQDGAYLALISHWPDLCPGGWASPPPAFDSLSRLPLASSEERMQFLDMLTYLPDDILTKVDRASMATSLEVRVPLLDHRLVEASWRVGLAPKLQNGVGKRILRRALYRRVPQTLIERPKMGFAIPIDAWLRGPLRDWADDLIGSLGWLQEMGVALAPVRAAWSAHLAGRANWGDGLWVMLMLADWRRRAGRAAPEAVAARAEALT